MSLLGDLLGFINSGRAANSISDSNIAAEHGVMNAVAEGQGGIHDATVGGQGYVNDALTNAGNNLYTAGQQANGVYGDVLSRVGDSTSPYRQAGQTGLSNLESYASSPNSQFSFNLDDYFNSPAYKFQLDQGNQQITNSMAAQGLGSSGAAAKEMAQFGQGLASQYYNQAFNQAQSAFTMNRDTTLAANGALVGAGEFGTGQYNQAQQNIGGQQADTTTRLASLLATLGLQGAEVNSATGMQGANTSANLGYLGSRAAGDYAVGAGEAHGAGILGQSNALGNADSDISNFLQLLAGLGG